MTSTNLKSIMLNTFGSYTYFLRLPLSGGIMAQIHHLLGYCKMQKYNMPPKAAAEHMRHNRRNMNRLRWTLTPMLLFNVAPTFKL